MSIAKPLEGFMPDVVCFKRSSWLVCRKLIVLGSKRGSRETNWEVGTVGTS